MDTKEQTVVEFGTSQGRGQPRKKTTLTINWDLTDGEMQDLAQAQLVTRLQNTMRQSGIVPDEAMTIQASEYKMGARHGKITLENISLEQLEAWLAKKKAQAS